MSWLIYTVMIASQLVTAWGVGHPAVAKLVLGPQTADAREQIESAPSGFVVVLLPGIYSTLCNVSVAQDISLHGAAGPMETTLDCGQTLRHLRISGPVNVSLHGLSFTRGQERNGGCIEVTNGAAVTISQSSFVDCHAEQEGGMGGALAVHNSSAHITDTSMRKTSAGIGGAISVVFGVVTVEENVWFHDVSAGYGGMAHVSGGHLQVSNNVVVQFCNAEQEGGMVKLLDSTMTAQGNVSIQDCRSGRIGGVSYLARSSLELLDNVHAERVSADGWGGFVFLHEDSGLTLRGNVSVTNSEAGNSAGCVYADESWLVAVQNVTFNRCHADVHGGGVFGYDAPIVLSEGVTFEQCSAGYDAGALLVMGATAKAQKDIRFGDCWAGGWGGSILLYHTHMELRNATITQSSSHLQGGGIYLEEAAQLQASELHARTSTANGAAGFMYVGPGSLAMVERAEVEDAWAEARHFPDLGVREAGSGGAFFVDAGGALELEKTSVRGSHAAAGGGGICAGGEEEGKAARVRLGEGVRVEGCSAEDGGAVFVQDGEVLLVEGVAVRECEAGRDGGMGWVLRGALRMEGAHVDGCRARRGGGGVFAAGPAAVSLFNCSLRGNTALGGSGGGLAARSANVEVVESVLEGNNASGDGGGLYAEGSAAKMRVEASTVAGGAAQGCGGGVAMSAGSTGLFTGQVVVWGNRAERGGGVFANGTVLDVVDARLNVTRNQAKGEGGGVRAEAVIRLVSGTTVLEENAATVGGGYSGEGSGAVLELGWGHTLEVAGCRAEADGGGLALRGGARVEVRAEGGRECPEACRGGAECEAECLRAECNFGFGECAEAFEAAGEDALQACDRGACPLQLQLAATQCAPGCLRQSCDFAEDNPACRAPLDALRAACPLFDAAALHSARAQPRVTFVQGGSSRGFGRCVDARCASAGGVCTTVDDGGRVLRLDNASAAVDVGESWGECADKPRLPGAGFDYDEAELQRWLAAPLPELLHNFPGCGAAPLAVRGNAAGRNGGGVFEAGCGEGGACFLGSMGAGRELAAWMVVEGNSAGGGGGGLFSECPDSVRACSALADRPLGLPATSAAGVAERRGGGGTAQIDASRPAVLELRANSAAAYGDGFASEPAALRVEVGRGRYVPGADVLELLVEATDAAGQAVQGGQGPLPYSVAVQLLPWRAPASSPDHAPSTMAAPALLPTLLFPAAALPLRTAAFSTALPVCPCGQDRLALRVSLLGGPFAALPHLAPPPQTLLVSCAPCPAGHALQVSAGAWNCSRCLPSEYLLDSTNPAHSCQPCPPGLHCNGTAHVRPRLPGAVWEAEGGELVLRSCPTGHAVAGGADPAARRCEACGAGEECPEAACTACTACPPGHYKPTPGAHLCSPCPPDSFATASGATDCQLCPPRSSTLQQEGRAALHACQCDPDAYPADNVAAAAVPVLECVACPSGAWCEEEASCLLRKGEEERRGCGAGPGLVGAWGLDNTTGQWMLQDCPEGYHMMVRSPEEQACKINPPRTEGQEEEEEAGAQGRGWASGAVVGAVTGGIAVVAVAVAGVVAMLRREWREQRDALAELRRGKQTYSTRELVPPKGAIDRARGGDAQAQALIHDMFPRHIAEAMMRGEQRLAEDRSEACGVFFSDIVGFTDISAQLEPAQVNSMLDRLFEQFDTLAALHGVYKIDTIGDCYIAVSNLVLDQQHQSVDQAARIAAFSLDAVAAAAATLIDPEQPDKGGVRIRAGFDVGPVVGHVQGRKQKKYTIFGNTVNTASRMESTGQPGKVQCTRRAADLLRAQDTTLQLARRGEVEVKGRGPMETFFVEGRTQPTPQADAPPPPAPATTFRCKLAELGGQRRMSKAEAEARTGSAPDSGEGNPQAIRTPSGPETLSAPRHPAAGALLLRDPSQETQNPVRSASGDAHALLLSRPTSEASGHSPPSAASLLAEQGGEDAPALLAEIRVEVAEASSRHALTAGELRSSELRQSDKMEVQSSSAAALPCRARDEHCDSCEDGGTSNVV